MLIKEASKITNLTKKAIEYYIEHGLITPTILDNGYRDFSKNDISILKRIHIFRKLGLSTDEIKAVFSDRNDNVLEKLTVKKELNIKKEKAKKDILVMVSSGKSETQIFSALKTIEQNSTITEKLLEAFPGYYGRFICLHFSRFLNITIITDEQQSAYEEIVAFLDKIPPIQIPEDLQAFLAENTKQLSVENIYEIMEQTLKSIENPDKFLSENSDSLEQYLAYKQSDEYKNSPVYKIQSLFKDFNNTSGYYDVFIPAMKKLSVSYSEYSKQMEIANEKLLSQYPEIKTLS